MSNLQYATVIMYTICTLISLGAIHVDRRAVCKVGGTDSGNSLLLTLPLSLPTPLPPSTLSPLPSLSTTLSLLPLPTEENKS